MKFNESSNSRKKISFFLGSMGRGGAERVISILSSEFANNGWNTHICLLLFNRVDYELDKSTKIFDFTGLISSRLKRIPYWLQSIRHYVKKEKPDVIISFAARINVLVLLATLGLHVKVIVSERNDPKHDGRGIITRLMVRLLYSFANKIVFQTKRSLQYFPKNILKKGEVIPNPISVSCYASNQKKKKIVTVGRLTKQKNQSMLISAFANIRKDFPDYELYIYGDGEQKGNLIALSEVLNVRNHVHFEGNIPNVHEEIADAELFVLSSDYEGLSNALLEALMMGIPCISTNCAGADEFINNETNGLLVHVGNEFDLCNAMKKVLGDDLLRIKFARNAKINSTSFEKDVVLKQWMNVIGDMKC